METLEVDAKWFGMSRLLRDLLKRGLWLWPSGVGRQSYRFTEQGGGDGAEVGVAVARGEYRVGAELASAAKRHIHRLVTQRVPGSWNIEADWLSRPRERGPVDQRGHQEDSIKGNPSARLSFTFRFGPHVGRAGNPDVRRL